MRWISPRRSIRARLVMIVLAVELLILTLITLNNLRQLASSLATQAEQYVEAQAPILNAAVLAPLIQRDYATIQSILDEGRGHSNLIYLSVSGTDGVQIAASGIPPDSQATGAGTRLNLPLLGTRRMRFDASMPITMYASKLGYLQIGLDIRHIWVAIDRLLWDGMQLLLLGLAASALLLAALLHFSITRHMTDIARGIRELENGNYRFRFRSQRDDELGSIARALNYMSNSVSQAFNDLRQSKINEEARLSIKVEERTTELNNSNIQLQTTLRDLKTAQSQLVQSEKMATLGQIVANVAHEINTPLGAVKSSGESISAALDQVLSRLSAVLLSLDETTRAAFFLLIAECQKPASALSTREERQRKRALATELTHAAIDNAQAKADVLLSLGVHDLPLRFSDILRHPRSTEILDTANQIGTIISGTKNINTAVDRVAKIVFALKSFSHTDHTGTMQLAQLKEGLETVLTIYSNQLKQGVDVTRVYGDVPAVLCLEDELNQVWTNLIHNALQAMQNKGQLTVTIATAADGVSVSVADNGPGIPDAIRDKIFDPFFTTKPVGEGSGLGLDIVRKIVDKHHGHIDLTSQVGVGTAFSVWLPLDPFANVGQQT